MKIKFFSVALQGLLVIAFVLPEYILAATDNALVTKSNNIKFVTSPSNRVAVLELYTSEGCSSCPPADRFLSSLKASSLNDNQLIPLAFHVTYWDYIGWRDRFANKKHDQRQRMLANNNNQSTIYTPQFVLSGNDYRHYTNLNYDVTQLVKQKSMVDILLSAQDDTYSGDSKTLHLTITSDFSRSKLSNIDVYIVLLENNLISNVHDGENEGKQLHHDFVVREMLGPFNQNKTNRNNVQVLTTKKIQLEQDVVIQPEWKAHDLSIVIFVQDPTTGEILQSVKLEY